MSDRIRLLERPVRGDAETKVHYDQELPNDPMEVAVLQHFSQAAEADS